MQDERNVKKQPGPYGLQLDRREHLALTGVKNVISFDENQVFLDTEGGLLNIEGQGLHVARLTLDEGKLVLDDTVNSIVYEGKRAGRRGSLVQRVFR